MAFIENTVIFCAGVLLLAAHFSTGTPLPPMRSGHGQASNDLESSCHEWRPDTNLENDTVTQVYNGITTYTRITPAPGPVLSMVCNQYTSEYIPRASIIIYYSFILAGSHAG
jgi:hypothetical protein